MGYKNALWGNTFTALCCISIGDVKEFERVMMQRVNKELHQMRQDFKDLEIVLHKKQAKIEELIHEPKNVRLKKPIIIIQIVSFFLIQYIS